MCSLLIVSIYLHISETRSALPPTCARERRSSTFAEQGGSNEDCEVGREFQRHRGLIERTRIVELELASRIVFPSPAASSFLFHGNDAASPSLAIPSYEIRVSARKLLLAVAARRSYCLARSFVGSFPAVTSHPHFLECCRRLKAHSPLHPCYDTGEIVQSKRKGNDIRVPACHENK